MKAVLRKYLRALRRGIEPAEHRRRSQSAVAAITHLGAFKANARIAVYLPFDGEAATAALLRAARRRGVRLFVPVIGDRRHRRLVFPLLSGRVRRGAFGILIPRRRDGMVAPRWFNLVVVPMVGVDEAGRRLGMGGGYYDHAFAFRRHRSHWLGPRLVGLAFDCQRTHTVHADVWDMRLDAVATESGLHPFYRGMP